MDELTRLVAEVRACNICDEHLPLGPRPVIQLSKKSRILVVGQAPGKRVHDTGLPFNDPSGDRLRTWMGVGRETFYDAQKIALLPMGFCFPGTGKRGDQPPRPECAIAWRARLLEQLQSIELTIVLGQYALQYHLGKRRKKNLTETVKNWQEYWPQVLPLPHPSPRNNLWLRKNPWLEEDFIPHLQVLVKNVLQDETS